jgi:hypothetical protein
MGCDLLMLRPSPRYDVMLRSYLPWDLTLQPSPPCDSTLRQCPLDLSTPQPQLLLDLGSDWAPQLQASRSGSSCLI